MTYENFITDLFKKKSNQKEKQYVKKYIIFSNDDFIIFGYVNLKGFPSDDYMSVDVIDSLSKNSDIIIKDGHYNHNAVDVIYTSENKVDAQNKFNKFLEEEPYATWILSQTAKKYNL